MLGREAVDRSLVAEREHELLAGDTELARRAVEPGEDDLLEHGLQAAGIAPLAPQARVGDGGRRIRAAAEGEVRDDYRGDGAERGEQRECTPTVDPFQRPIERGTRAESASNAARKNGLENASVTARSS